MNPAMIIPLILFVTITSALQSTTKNHSLSVYFAPLDNIEDLEVEVQLAQNVTAARKLCNKAHFEPSQNPFFIKYSVYNLMMEPAIEALIDAHSNNVFVQVLVEYSQMWANDTWNTFAQNFSDANMTIVKDNIDCRPVGTTNCSFVNLIGVRSYGVQFMGLMHTKMRLFHFPSNPVGCSAALGDKLDQDVPSIALVTGSLNPDDEAIFNDETLLLSQHDYPLWQHYHRVYNAILSQEVLAFENTYDSSRPINVLFSKGSNTTAVEHLFHHLEAEQELIFIFCYSIRDMLNWGFRNASDSSSSTFVNEYGDTFVNQLAKAKARGVSVVVMTDIKEVYGEPGFSPPDATHTAMRIANLGIPMYMCNNTVTAFTAFHHKNGLFGLSRMFVITDTSNWSESAMGNMTISNIINTTVIQRPRNDETTMFIDSYAYDQNKTGLRFLSTAIAMLRKYEDQNIPLGQEPADEIVTTLMHQRGAAWPTVSTTVFVAFDVPAATTPFSSTFAGLQLNVSSWGQKSATIIPMAPRNKRHSGNATEVTHWVPAQPSPFHLPFGARYTVVLQAVLLNGATVTLLTSDGQTEKLFVVDPANRTLESMGLASLESMSIEFQMTNVTFPV